MIFNLEKNVTRNLIDKGDLLLYILNLAATNRFLDKATLAVVAKLIEYISDSFDKTQPKVNVLTPISINEYYLNKYIKKIYKLNKKLIKKNFKKGITLDLDEPKTEPEASEPEFNKNQVKQLEELLKNENINQNNLILELTNKIDKITKMIASKDAKSEEVKTKKK